MPLTRVRQDHCPCRREGRRTFLLFTRTCFFAQTLGLPTITAPVELNGEIRFYNTRVKKILNNVFDVNKKKLFFRGVTRKADEPTGAIEGIG